MPAGVKVVLLFVPAGVSVCVCVAMALPVNVSAGTVKLDPAAAPPMAVNAPVLEPAFEPEVVATEDVLFVPAGVPALTADVVP